MEETNILASIEAAKNEILKGIIENKNDTILKSSEAEHSAILSSIQSSKNELIIIADDKKRVAQEKVDLEEGNKSLVNSKEKLENCISTLSTQKTIQEIKYKELDQVYIDRKLVLESDFQDAKKSLSDLEEKKLLVENQISNFLGIQLESKKDLNSIQDSVIANQLQLNELNSYISTKTQQVVELVSEIDTKQKTLVSLSDKISVNEDIFKTIEEGKILLDSVNKDIIDTEAKLISMRNDKMKELEDELSILKIEIEKNREINKTEESKHFSLLSKQQTLDSKEAFIKNQYERAGIKWEE